MAANRRLFGDEMPSGTKLPTPAAAGVEDQVILGSRCGFEENEGGHPLRGSRTLGFVED
jgi:hypothetical protein